MCLAVPGRIEEIDGSGLMKMAKVNFSGLRKDVCIEGVPEAKQGDYVIVHAGFALNLLNQEEAQKTLALLREVEQAPQSLMQWDSKKQNSAQNG